MSLFYSGTVETLEEVEPLMKQEFAKLVKQKLDIIKEKAKKEDEHLFDLLDDEGIHELYSHDIHPLATYIRDNGYDFWLHRLPDRGEQTATRNDDLTITIKIYDNHEIIIGDFSSGGEPTWNPSSSIFS